MLYPELEERLGRARHAFETSTAENLVDTGNEYLTLLEEYIGKLYSHPGRRAQPANPLAYEMVDNLRRAIESAIEHSERERERVETLLHPLEEMTASEAVATLNRLNYKGLNNWEVKMWEVTGGPGRRMSPQEAVNLASDLLCEEYVGRRNSPDV
jgi:hypothetical protein